MSVISIKKIMYCTNCGNKLSDHANFCPYCGHKVEGIIGANPYSQETSQTTNDALRISNAQSGPTESRPTKKASASARNFIIPILIMFFGGWLGGFACTLLAPGLNIVQTGTLVYLVLSELYIISCYSSLSNKHSKIATNRSIFVLISGALVVVVAFFSYALENMGIAFVLFFLALGLMITDSILDSTSPVWD